MLLTLCGQQLSSDRKVDSLEYEEIARAMMGKEAYLIFVFDKLITQVTIHSQFNLIFRP